jgi:uncharacterized membrane protein YsdA (DUF1294 family)
MSGTSGRTSPMVRYALFGFGLAIALTAALWVWLGADLLLAWLVGINVVTFATYGYDKRIAGSEWMRVPERLLLVLALVGGTAGALVGMQVFHHKTLKGSFRIRFWGIVAVQVALIAAYVYWRLRS